MTKKKVIFATPTMIRPMDPYLASLEASVPYIIEAGWDEGAVYEVGCPYISAARNTLTRKALDANADVIIYLDHDVSWEPKDLLKLLETDGDVVAGTYRYKKEEEQYMGAICSTPDWKPVVRKDGCIKADTVPAGFLKITRNAIRWFMKSYPDLLYGDPERYTVDLFNHGAYKGTWYGEDCAFSRNWKAIGGEIWLVPDLNITHHHYDGTAFPGNFHEFLLRQPGGSKHLKAA
jgi:glycosyltransferase involved in cell wall biosynthesis